MQKPNISPKSLFNKYSWPLKAFAKTLIFAVFLVQFIQPKPAFSYAEFNECSTANNDLIAGSIPRTNCKDLIDLPLCSLFSSGAITVDPKDDVSNNTASYKNTINCVKECSDPIFARPNSNTALKRGVDYAVHNKDCIRFRSAANGTSITESGETVILTTKNSIKRKCHQLSDSETPDPDPSSPTNNCDLTPCNLLTIEELKDGKPANGNAKSINKFSDENKQYCEDTGVKCYNFSVDKLPYVFYRLKNKMCRIHQCKPDAEQSQSAICNPSVFDEANVTAKGADYVQKYKYYIDPYFQDPLKSVCEPIACKPIYYRKYRCTPEAQENPTTKNPSCDTDSVCLAGYCSKKIDCNLTANNNEAECKSGTSTESTKPSATSYANGWLYRPYPPRDLLTQRSMDKANKCFSMGDMENNGWGHRVRADAPFDFIDLGYFHAGANEYPRSPGLCGKGSSGSRGNGYIYLCGTNGNMYQKPSESVGFNEDYVKSIYNKSTKKFDYQINTCLRYKNSGRLNVCGSRECSPDCGFSICEVQWCGHDLCRTLTVHQDRDKECSNADASEGADCSGKMGGGASIDSYVRVRAVKYGNRICTFLDVKGTTAYSNPGGVSGKHYFTGKEKLEDGTCVDGSADTNGECNGKDTNNDAPNSTIWRTLMMIKHVSADYASSPVDSSIKGFYDLDGRFFKKQECASIPLVIGPPRFYTIANRQNSETLFSPPLYISKVKVIKGGADSENNKTDFYYPEIEVKFGKSTKLLSLSKDKDGSEATPEASSVATLTEKISAKEYTVNVSVKKEFDVNRNEPIFCLYIKYLNNNGQTASKKVGCADREKPGINEVVGGKNRKTILAAPSTNTYLNFSMSLQLLASYGNNNVNDSCLSSKDDDCSPKLTFNNPTIAQGYCQKIEKYEFCATREPCSELVNECITNEIALAALTANSPDYSAKYNIKQKCDTSLLTTCNAKWGINSSSTITDVGALVSNLQANNFLKLTGANDKAYGWFNEACISKGFETKLVDVVAYNIPGAEGKCLVNSQNSCPSGGNAAKNCPCTETNGKTLAQLNLSPAEYEIRKQTPREAGLCIDIPYPALCPAITYQTAAETEPFTTQSLNKTFYDNATGVHLSHKARTDDSKYGHAEFASVFGGTSNVKGKCNGFWKNNIDSTSGLTKVPTMNCKADGTWDQSSFANSCIRYSCEAATTVNMERVIDSGNNEVNIYTGTYSTGETGSNQGLRNGFANWNKIIKTTDFPETVNGSCIPGFKKQGSSLNESQTDFTGGITPTRSCNQKGNWSGVTSPCVRVTCPASNLPADPVTQSEINQWMASGGATFPQANASRSKTQIIGAKVVGTFEENTVVEGTCNEAIGFFQLIGAPKPTRKCNYLGIWEPVINPCVTRCEAIDTEAEAKNSSNGFAYWKQAINPIGSSTPGVLDNTKGNAGCVAGYVKSPYSSNIPANVNNIFNPGGVPTEPKKACSLTTTTSGKQRYIWEQSKDPCVDYCPGSGDDSRIGVGRTNHKVKAGTISVSWSRGEFNKYTYYSNVGQNPGVDKFGNSNQGSYFLKRYCYPNGKWSEPEILCGSNYGQIGNAYYGISPAHNNNNLVARSETELAGTCVPGYKNSGAAPIRQCVFKDGNKNIDEVYLALKAGSSECTEVTCTVSNGEIFNDSANNTNSNAQYIYKGATTTKIYNQTIPLVCGPGYLDNTGTATCQSSGWVLSGNCIRGKSCTFNWWHGWADATGCSSGDGSGFPVINGSDSSLQNVRHGEVIGWSIYDKCGGGCSFQDFSARCNNGAFETRSINDDNPSLWYRQGSCDNTYYYNWDSRIWIGKKWYAPHGSGIIFFNDKGANPSTTGRYINDSNVVKEFSYRVW